MTTLLQVMTPLMALVEKGPEAKDVKAGWVGLLVFLGLGLAVVFLAFSLRKHLGKVDFEESPDENSNGSAGNGASRS